jgi:hypothetical protein
MATVHYGEHEPFEIDGNRPDLVAYYRGEGATVTGVPGETVEGPAKSAPKADWVAFAVAQGADEADAEALTKAELVEQYGAE